MVRVRSNSKKKSADKVALHGDKQAEEAMIKTDAERNPLRKQTIDPEQAIGRVIIGT